MDIRGIRNSLAHRFRKLFARVAYRRRLKRYERIRIPSRWRSTAALIAADLPLAKEVDGDDVFGKELLGTLSAGREQIDKKLAQRASISTILTVFLVSQALAFDLNVSVLGVALKPAPKIYEILILVSALITAWTLPLIANRHVLSVAIKALIHNVYPASATYLVERAQLPDEPPYVFLPTYQPTLIWSKFKSRYAWFTIAYLTILIAMSMVFAGVTRYFIYMHAFEHPGFDWSYYLLGLSVFAEISAAIFLLFFVLPLPHKDYSAFERLQVLEQINQEAALKERAELFKAQFEDTQRMKDLGYLAPEEK